MLRQLGVYHANLLHRWVQGDALGAASDRMQCRLARINAAGRLRAVAERAAADVVDRGAAFPAGSSRETSCPAASKVTLRVRAVVAFRAFYGLLLAAGNSR